MKYGEVILVKFPFADLESSKKRPALVLNKISTSPKHQLITIAMITSKIDGLKLHGDVLLKDWINAKLLHPSLVRLSKIATIDSELSERQLGTISPHDRKKIGRVFSNLFSHWIV